MTLRADPAITALLAKLRAQKRRERILAGTLVAGVFLYAAMAIVLVEAALVEPPATPQERLDYAFKAAVARAKLAPRPRRVQPQSPLLVLPPS